MAQAKKKKTNTNSGFSLSWSGHGIGMLLAGVVMGVMGTILWQGLNDRSRDVGSGIRQMIESSKKQQTQVTDTAPGPEVKPEPQSTNYDFYTVLPEIEVVVTEDEPEATPVPPAPASSESTQSVPSVPEVEVEKPQVTSSAYMLQAGSYNRRNDAERLKANLALMGLSSTIQKVTIQDRGDFYRVRLGPYTDQARMREADQQLQQNGIKAMRLKVSRAQPG